MKNNQTKHDFLKHLHNYLVIGILAFIGMLVFSSLFVIFDDNNPIFTFEVPIVIHYLGMFISSMMLIMGAYYVRYLDKFVKK